MNTIVCYIDYPGRYDSQVNYAANTIECEWCLIEKDKYHRGCTGEIITCTLDALLASLCGFLEKRARYRIISNNARLAILNSDIVARLEDGTLRYRDTSGEWVNRETGSIETVKSVIHVASTKVSIVCLEHCDTGAEVTILGTENYGIVWHEHCRSSNIGSEPTEGMEEITCDLLQGIVSGGIGILSEIVNRYNSVCRKYKLGKPAMTTASQGMESHRWIKGSDKFKQTTCPKALELEIAGHHGGVQLPFGYGRYDGECHMYDISSFYPHLATINPLPVKHVQSHEKPTADDIRQFMAGYYVIARADIKADGYYPFRSGFETLYPSGCIITTVLHNCELQRAILLRHILAIHAASEYETAFALKPNCEHLLSIRTAAERTGDKLTAHWAKCIAVGYCGKVGSKLSCWEDDARVFPVDDKSSWIAATYGRGNMECYRNLFGRVQRKRNDLVTTNGSIAAAGALTAYGRERLWSLVALCGKENVLYVSTDSIVVNSVGKRRIDPYVSGKGFIPGSVRHVCQSDNCVIAGNGIYTLGRKHARQGFSRDGVTGNIKEWTELPDTYEDVIDKASSVPFKFHHNEKGRENDGHEQSTSIQTGLDKGSGSSDRGSKVSGNLFEMGSQDWGEQHTSRHTSKAS